MKTHIFTGNYKECKHGNLISISGDRGKKVGFNGKALPQLAPKRSFWEIWHNNIGKISEKENTKYYIEQYYKQVLAKVDIEGLLKNEKNPILLCYEKANEFCHRHIVAEYISLKYGIDVPDISISDNLEITKNSRPAEIREILNDIIQKEKEEEEVR